MLSTRVAPQLGPLDRVLEVGPGKLATGHFIGPHTLGQASYTAIDVRVLSHHRRLHSPHGFAQMSAVDLGFPTGCFDVVLCCNVLAHVADYRGALAEMSRCMKDDAVWIAILHRGIPRTMSALEYRRSHPELTDEWFSENGDQWIYGEDFFDHVEEAGMDWQLYRPNRELPQHTVQYEGLKPDQEIIVGFTSHAGRRRFGFEDG